ncbi:unnamed protein product [Phytophthora fragariaefolia]|uniref:Unnamed protein product n=1 Tax=Phytophthora fragariaefolia TaxID=1490495 RepID=A0A9W6XIU6_9STRA|nr:unnamed protein product [Phytophthora fragariaefolia]
MGAGSSESDRDNDESEIDTSNDEGSAYVDEDNVGENSKADEASYISEQSTDSLTPAFQSPQPMRNNTLTQERQAVAQLYLDTLFAFTPARETWMKAKRYKPIGRAYIVGRIC